MSILGEDVKRTDAPAKVTGEVEFTNDIRLPGSLVAKVKRSPYPHATVESVETGPAEAIDGVKAVLTHEDVPDNRNGGGAPVDQAILNTKVRFVGDVVAAVAAVDEETARNAVHAIEVTYEQLPGVFDPEEAMRDDAPAIHDHVDKNIAGETRYETGDVTAAFERADHVIETKTETGRQVHVSPEPYTCVAEFDRRKGANVELWTSVDKPYHFRDELASVLGMPSGNIRLRMPEASSASLGKKNYLIPSIEPIAVLLSKRAEKPVKLSLDRDEDFYGTVTRHPCKFRLRSGVTEDGEIIGRSCELISDTGAYVQMGNHVKDAIKSRFADLYPVEHMSFTGYNVYTNHPIAGSARGIGTTQIHFAMETHMDTIAEELDIDPVELRQRHHIQEGERKSNGDVVGSCGLPECLERGAAKANWPDGTVEGDHTGIGMACSIHISGSSRDRGCSAGVKFSSDGTVDLLLSNPDSGHGSDSMAAQVLADVLEIETGDVRVSKPDTAVTPPDTYGSTASRSSYIVSRAVTNAGTQAKTRLLEEAALQLDVPTETLEYSDGTVSAPDGPSLDIGDIVSNGRMIQAVGSFDNPKSRSTFGTYFAEVSVDPATGFVTVKRIVGAQDVGFVINPAGCEAQIEGGVEFAMEFLLDELRLEQGQPRNSTVVDYKALTAEGMPDSIESILVESAKDQGIDGAKGLGTGVMPAIAPAIANAIYDATGQRVYDTPLDLEEMLHAFDNGAI